jgi:hypothetical protein
MRSYTLEGSPWPHPGLLEDLEEGRYFKAIFVSVLDSGWKKMIRGSLARVIDARGRGDGVSDHSAHNHRASDQARDDRP